MAPSDQQMPARDALVEYVKRGRDAGLSLILATQQPSAIDDRILSQVNIALTHRLLSRVSRQIAMQTLPQHEAKDFIKGILNFDRAIKPEPKPYRPFDEGAIDSVVSQMNSITPRRIMKTMERVLELVRTAGLDPKSKVASSDFLDEHGITDEIAAIPL